jgi:hypothetical protein
VTIPKPELAPVIKITFPSIQVITTPQITKLVNNGYNKHTSFNLIKLGNLAIEGW